MIENVDDQAVAHPESRKPEESGGGDRTRASEVESDFYAAYEKLSPNNTPAPTHHWLWYVVCAIALVLVVVGIILGIMKLSPQPPKVATKTTEADLYISSHLGDIVVLLAGEDGTYDQIKVATTVTNTVIARDLAQGTFSATSAVLDSQGNRVAYIREENGHRKAVVVDLTTGAETLLDGDLLKVAPTGEAVEPCTWSPVSWSPNGESFAFFGCDRANSYVIIVQARTELSPFAVKDTESSQFPHRQVFWLDDQSVVFSSVDPTSKRSWIGRVEAKADAVASRIYSR